MTSINHWQWQMLQNYPLKRSNGVLTNVRRKCHGTKKTLSFQDSLKSSGTGLLSRWAVRRPTTNRVPRAKRPNSAIVMTEVLRLCCLPTWNWAMNGGSLDELVVINSLMTTEADMHQCIGWSLATAMVWHPFGANLVLEVISAYRQSDD